MWDDADAIGHPTCPCHRSKRQTSDDSSFLDEGPVNGQFTEPGKSRASSNIDYYDVNTPGLSHLNVVSVQLYFMDPVGTRGDSRALGFKVRRAI
jgi:hypothetical protein